MNDRRRSLQCVYQGVRGSWGCMSKYDDLGFLNDFGYCRDQSSKEDCLATLGISEIGRYLWGLPERIASLGSESTSSL